MTIIKFLRFCISGFFSPKNFKFFITQLCYVGFFFFLHIRSRYVVRWFVSALLFVSLFIWSNFIILIRDSLIKQLKTSFNAHVHPHFFFHLISSLSKHIHTHTITYFITRVQSHPIAFGELVHSVTHFSCPFIYKFIVIFFLTYFIISFIL